MPSHTDTDPKMEGTVPGWMPEWHVKGNSGADISASAAAELDCVPEAEANKIVKVFGDFELIQNGLIDVTRMLPQRSYNKVIINNLQYKQTHI